MQGYPWNEPSWQTSHASQGRDTVRGRMIVFSRMFVLICIFIFVQGCDKRDYVLSEKIIPCIAMSYDPDTHTLIQWHIEPYRVDGFTFLGWRKMDERLPVPKPDNSSYDEQIEWQRKYFPPANWMINSRTKWNNMLLEWKYGDVQ